MSDLLKISNVEYNGWKVTVRIYKSSHSQLDYTISGMAADDIEALRALYKSTNNKFAGMPFAEFIARALGVHESIE